MLCISVTTPTQKLLSLHIFRQAGSPQRVDCLAPKWEIALSVFPQDKAMSAKMAVNVESYAQLFLLIYPELLRLSEMYYALCLSYHSTQKLFCLHVFRQAGPPQRVDCHLQLGPELIKTYDVLSSVFNYIEALIAQLKGCLLDCFDCKLSYRAVLVY